MVYALALSKWVLSDGNEPNQNMNALSSSYSLPLSRLLAAPGIGGVLAGLVGAMVVGVLTGSSQPLWAAVLASATLVAVVMGTFWFVWLGSRMQCTLAIVVVAGSIVRGVVLLAAGAVVHYALGPDPLAYWLGLVCGWVGVKMGELWVVSRALAGVRVSGTGRVA